MSPSSSGSWSGTRGADIIDLDRYMRGGVRPSRPLSDDSNQGSCEQLVVDAGGGTRKTCSYASGDARLKRYSQDSGVSDGSYACRLQRRQHRHKPSNQDSSYTRTTTREPPSARTLGGRANSSTSLKAFRTVCEQALLDQQRQIARVAQLCEQLNQRAEQTKQDQPEPVEKSVRSEKFERPAKFKRSEKFERQEKSDQDIKSDRSEKSMKNLQERCLRMERCRSGRLEKIGRTLSVETSEISSSSRSTKDLRRKDTYRTQECKTYKIIMNKLDELNRLFATRPTRPAVRPSRPRTPSSTSVSVCDKLVCTDPQRFVNKILMPTVQVANPTQNRVLAGGRSVSLGPRTRSSTVTQAFAVDIAPSPPPTLARPNVVTESIVKCDSSNEGSKCSAADPRCGFDLEDPVHLYSQAKRMQALAATTRRARSAEPAGSTGPASAGSLAPAPAGPASCDQAGGRGAPSLCAVCRASWRCVRRCLAATLLGKVVDPCHSS